MKLFARALLLLPLTACINLFTIEEDVELGMQLRDQINNDPKNFPVVDRTDEPAAYAELDRMLDTILQSQEIRYRDEFAWEIYLIDDDKTLNAFAAPGGYIWVYTGLMEYLTVEDHFIGVLGHEVAHADRRHSSSQLQTQLGIDLLLDVILGEDRGSISQVAEGLLGLKFGRDDETESDAFAVRYLCDSGYAADGVAGFFRQIEEDGGGGGPEFLSSHPNPDNRIEAIEEEAMVLGCPTALNPDVGDWADVLATLP